MASGFLSFKATIEKVGINPFVQVPDEVLDAIFLQAKRETGPIPVKGILNQKSFTQNLVKFRGIWRLYINTKMLPTSPKRIGEIISIRMAYNTTPIVVKLSPDFLKALAKDRKAKKVYDNLPPYLQKEIHRYLQNLKTRQSLELNVQKALQFLKGQQRFIGRNLPLVK